MTKFLESLFSFLAKLRQIKHFGGTIAVHFLLSLLLVVMLSGCTSIKNNVKSWDKTDTARQLVFTAILATDGVMTDDTARHPESREEINPILGKHPSRGAVTGYFIGCGFAHATISAVLPQKINDDKGNPIKIFGVEVNPRAIWQYFWIGTEGIFVGYSL
jgi:hypothetical protein